MVKKLTMVTFTVIAFGCMAFGARHVFYGQVSDSMCGVKHHRTSAAEISCVKKCVAGGAQYVLVVRESGAYKVYQVAPQSKFADYAGKHVRVQGSLSGTTITAETVSLPHYMHKKSAASSGL
jgi:hypothetical protein